MELLIKNFQSVRDAQLEFGPGLTMIAGPSDHGKTAILRAVKALLTNRSGREFISYGTNQCSVVIDGIEWHKGADSRYVIDGNSFTRLGVSVPPEVYEKLSIFPVDIDGDKVFLNLNEQFDGPFLLLSSPSKVAKLFGNFSSIDVVYGGMAKCVKDQRAIQNKISYLETRNQEIESLLDKYPDVESIFELFSQYQLLTQYKEAIGCVFTFPAIQSIDFRPYVALRRYKMLIDSIDDSPALEDFDFSSLISLRRYCSLMAESLSISEELSSVDFDKCPVCGQEVIKNGHDH